jgi:hypothetical protein
MLAVCALVTRWVKVSLLMAFRRARHHDAPALGSPIGWVLLAMMPALAWSRLAVQRHRPSEVAIGLLVGTAFGCGISNL